MTMPSTLIISLLLIPLLACQTDALPPALADTESRVITSAITSRDYQITVALPRGYSDATETYPVLYMVDANGQFGTVVEAARQMRFEEAVPELIVVGIGYPVGRMWNAQPPRNVDLTPTSDPEWVRRRPLDFPQFPAPEGSGGAPGFLRFMIEELMPFVEREYRADPSNRALYGHSFGGLFGVYALLHSEGAFGRFIIASPSLWWDNRVSFELESAYKAKRGDLPARVFFSVGELEEEDRFHMVANLRELISIVESRRYEGLDFTVRYFGDETHNSVIPRTIVRGLMWIYRDWRSQGA